MYTIATNQFNDLYIETNGNIASASDQAAMEQSLKQSLSALTDEYTFNLRGGVNYNATAFSKTPGWQAVLSAEIRTVAAAITGVNSVVTVLVWETEGLANFAISVVTEFGVINLATGE